MVDIPALHERIAARASDFVAALFGDRARSVGPDKWRVGSHGSLAIEVTNGRLLFNSFENQEDHGDAIDLWRRERGGTFGDALRACAAWAGCENSSSRTHRAPHRACSPVRKPERPPVPDMPQAVFAQWQEGRRFAWPKKRARYAKAIDDIACWRGWPHEYVETLVRSGVLTMPLYFGERTRAAFPVCEPITWKAAEDDPADYMRRDRPRFVGFHTRLRERDGEDRGWRFVPSKDEKQGRPSLPPLPLVLAGCGAFGHLWDKRVLIVVEGEWDALTLPVVAGWFDVDLGLLRLPPALAIVGVLGASGTDVFLKSYARFWPRDVCVLVLRDGDKAGGRWAEAGGIVDQLKTRSARVASLHFGKKPGGKRRDVNDLYRDGCLDRSAFDDLLGEVGWALAQLESAEPRAA